MFHLTADIHIRNTSRTLIALGAFCLGLFPLHAVRADTTSLAPLKLRGYGTLSAAYSKLPTIPGGSDLVITCDNVPKAQVLLAKYLSDLTCLPGVTDAALPDDHGIAAHVVAGLGAIAAVRSGRTVYILTASDLTGLTALASSVLPKSAIDIASRPEVEAPMYLDRWDRFGFRFYYRPWETPALAPGQTYDVGEEFKWAKKMGRSGFVFWDDMNALDTAEGMTNEVWWDWAQSAAEKATLPTAINDSMFANLNRYRDQQEWKMPQYVGDFYTIAGQEIGGWGLLSWNATTAANEGLGLVQSTIRNFNRNPNVVSWLEPHGELNHGPQEIFQEYGPAADDGYRRYLKECYKTPSAVSERWFGNSAHFKSWNEVQVPELASFLGWGTDALDLTGSWRVGYEPFTGAPPSANDLAHYGNRRVEGTIPAPDDWYRSTFDDTSWPSLVAPGNDAMMFLTKRPAVFRRSFHIPTAWLGSHPRVYLYVWDLTLASGDTVRVWLNDNALADSPCRFNTPHWGAWDVSKYMKPGSNFLAVRMPKGYVAYRTYLSPDPPVQYPNLGVHKNAQWLDFANWQQWCRVGQVKRGMEMIRQIDPNRNITQMHPDEYADAVKDLAEDYGAEFHNTGYMGAFFADLDPLLMQGSELPCSVEPGGPAPDLATYKRMMGLYYSEGLQGVDYFIHIGDIMWRPDIRAYFEATQNQVHILGKYHAPAAQVAVLYSYKANAPNTYPWGSDPNVNLGSGYWNWNLASNLMQRCARDGITDRDFARGNAAKYKVIVDSNTSVMDGATVDDIKRYVQNGGTFVTYAQTGRHDSLRLDTWPISRLTGYHVTHIDKLDSNGNPIETRSLRPAPGQTVFRESTMSILNAAPANGLTLQPATADVQDLLLWPDGSVAAGYRRIGKGYIVEIGCKWTGSNIFDRIEPGGNGAQPRALTALLSSLMDWRGIPNIPATITSSTSEVLLRHWVSNNGLFDVWTLWNQSSRSANTVNLTFPQQIHPSAAYDVDLRAPAALISDASGNHIPDITIGPEETRIFLTTRQSVQTAALDWLNLQRSWWRGVTPAPASSLPAPTHRFSLDLSRGWSWKPLTESGDIDTIRKAQSQDMGWTQLRLGIWSIPYHPAVKHAVFQKTFKVPEAWTTGRISLWLTSWFSNTFYDKGAVWLDGALVKPMNDDGITGEDFGGKLKPGTTHTLTVEAMGARSLAGLRGTCWLAWKPAPQTTIDLSGQWTPSPDLLHYDTPISMPGPFRAFSIRRSIAVPDSYRGKTIIFSADAPNPMVGVLVNGHWVRRQHHMKGDQWSLNISPWVKSGAINDIEMVCWNGAGTGRVKSVSLDAYSPGAYP